MPPRGLASVALGLPTSPMGTAFMEGRPEGKMVVLAAELSGPCGKILARLDQGKSATGKLPSGILPCPTQLSSRRQLGFSPAPGLGHGHSAPGLACLGLARSFLIPTTGHSLFILPSSPSTRHCPGTSSSPPPCPELPYPLFIYWAGGGVRAQARRESHCPGVRGGHSNHGLLPSPG